MMCTLLDTAQEEASQLFALILEVGVVERA
jgi:hypothetical protein